MKKYIGYLLLLLPRVLWADVPVTVNSSGLPSNSQTVGGIANNLTTMSDFFSTLLNNIFYIIGVALLTASIIKYREFRNNPSQTPLSRPILFFICGLILASVPFMLHYLSARGVAYTVPLNA